jgi:copper oxidase (laccase) domain-containing protein
MEVRPYAEKWKGQACYLQQGSAGSAKVKFESMNLALNRGDDRLSVEQNYLILCEAWGLNSPGLCFHHKLHGDEIRPVPAETGKRTCSIYTRITPTR